MLNAGILFENNFFLTFHRLDCSQLGWDLTFSLIIRVLCHYALWCANNGILQLIYIVITGEVSK